MAWKKSCEGNIGAQIRASTGNPSWFPCLGSLAGASLVEKLGDGIQYSAESAQKEQKVIHLKKKKKRTKAGALPAVLTAHLAPSVAFQIRSEQTKSDSRDELPLTQTSISLERPPELEGKAGIVRLLQSYEALFLPPSYARACYLVERSQTRCGRRMPR